MMFKKKYIVIAVGIISVLLASLLVNNIILAQSGGEYDPWMDLNDDGVVDVNDLQILALIYGTSGTPMNKTELLLELQDRVSTLEEKANQVKTIRFCDPTEYYMYERDVWSNASTFEWTPENSTNNVLLRIMAYAEVKGYESQMQVVVYTENKTYYKHDGWMEPTYDYRWIEPMVFTHNSTWIFPNQQNYVFQFQVKMLPAGTAFYRNINLIITVVDGLPASN